MVVFMNAPLFDRVSFKWSKLKYGEVNIGFPAVAIEEEMSRGYANLIAVVVFSYWLHA